MTAIEMPARTVRPRRPRSELVGHVLATAVGAAIAAVGALLAWLIRRANIAVPALVTLTAVPIFERHDAAAVQTVDARNRTAAPESGPGAALPLSPRVSPSNQRLDQEPIAQMPGTPVKPKQKSPTRLQPAPQPSIAAPSPTQLAELYTQVGRVLAAATKAAPASTLDLWPRFRWVNFMDAIRTPAKRAAAAAVLEKLLVEANKLQP